jgi:hypothetical protein
MITRNHMNINTKVACLIKEILATTLQRIIVNKFASIKDITEVDDGLNTFPF